MATPSCKLQKIHEYVQKPRGSVGDFLGGSQTLYEKNVIFQKILQKKHPYTPSPWLLHSKLLEHPVQFENCWPKIIGQ